ncbi:MAB_1171c family putative transporter [Streptomyces silvisoli]|uniref:DUF6545 domain-containing protein n=1 Tax=Streptomyces silvisoli TaxID=3034235 RepID=A0ABT5ZL72_9ACTN|nr:MAB_1171c family putative transporter [Streptomyces silvisoli]MDF3290582.1 hypothetical protein [Streptomyces silvisoli]
MQQFLHPLCLTLAIAGFLLLLWPPRYLRQDLALAALVGVYGFSALSFLVSLEPVWRVLDEVTGRPSTGILVAFSSVVALLALQPVVLAYWALPPDKARNRARLCTGAGAVVILALTLLFFQLTPAGRTTPQGFTANYIHTAAYRTYLTLYVVVYAIGETVLAVGCWQAARRTGQVWIARGLRIVGVGALLTLGYSAVRLADVGAALAHVSPPPAAIENFAWLCADGGTTLTLVGFFVPIMAVHVVPHVRTWARANSDYQSLAPLWEALHHAVPTVALQPARTAVTARVRLWNTSWHLYRRAVEIRDAQCALESHLEESVRDEAERRHRAAGLTGTELTSAVTADQLRAALVAYRSEKSPKAPTEYADAGTREEVCTPQDDVRALLRIAAHFETPFTEQESATHGSDASVRP